MEKYQGYVSVFGSPFKGDLFEVAKVLSEVGIHWKGTSSDGGGSILVRRGDKSIAEQALEDAGFRGQ